MADRPIIFSAPMVRALLAGEKTQTRRPLNLSRYSAYLRGYGCTGLLKNYYGDHRLGLEFVDDARGLWHETDNPAGRSAWYVPIRFAHGDRLYVREVWRPIHSGDRSLGAEYRADKPADWRDQTVWRKSGHMPRWASRLTLAVEDVRVQRLQQISEADCLAEGPRIKGYAEFRFGRSNLDYAPSSLDGVMVHTDQEHVYATPRCWYRELWGSLHTNAGERWDDNPWVVAITFRAVPGNIDRIEATP